MVKRWGKRAGDLRSRVTGNSKKAERRDVGDKPGKDQAGQVPSPS